MILKVFFFHKYSRYVILQYNNNQYLHKQNIYNLTFIILTFWFKHTDLGTLQKSEGPPELDLVSLIPNKSRSLLSPSVEASHNCPDCVKTLVGDGLESCNLFIILRSRGHLIFLSQGLIILLQEVETIIGDYLKQEMKN